MSFDLLRQPWLPVVDLAGSPDQVGLLDLLTDAKRLWRIVGETPPMTAALYRLVLAFLHRVYGPANRDAWRDLWDGEGFPRDPIDKYLGAYGDRFDLFDSDRPFFQCPAVASVPPSGAAKLVPYRAVGNNTTLFDHTTARDELLLTPAETARWLVTVQAYDPGGLKTPYRTSKSSTAAHANLIGLALVEAANLRDTLLINLVPYRPAHNQPRTTAPSDCPAWEREPPGPEPDERVPDGWTDLLTWQPRRVWLAHRSDGEVTVVDKVVITPGTRLRAELEDNEWMAAYRRFPTARKVRKGGRSSGQPAYGPWRPVRLEDRRGVWRHSKELLLAPVHDEQYLWRRPPALDHVADMSLQRCIPPDTVYTLRVFGQQLDSKGAIVEQVLEQAVSAPIALLRVRDPAAGPVIGRSVELADSVGEALHVMVADYLTTFREKLPARNKRPPFNLELSYWPLLAAPFGHFLAVLPEQLPTKRLPAVREWSTQVRRIAERAAQQWAEDAPRVGRDLDIAAQCYGRFIGQLGWHVSQYHRHATEFADIGEAT